MISKCPHEIIVSSKIQTKSFLDFCPEIFCSFLGASLKLFGASYRLPYVWYYLLCPQEAHKASRKPPEIYKKISGQKSRNDFVGFLEEVFRPKEHFEINWPLRTLRNPFQLSEKNPTMFVCTFDTFTNNLVYFSSKYLTRNWSQIWI